MNFKWSLVIGAVVAYQLTLAWLLETVQFSTIGVVTRAANFVAILTVIHASWLVSLAEASRNARTISGAYCFQALGILINMATAWAGSSEIQTMQGTGINNLAYVTVIMVALIASISYVGLSIERANTAELVLAQHALRVAQWQGKHQTITRSDRTKLLSMLSESVSQAMLQLAHNLLF